MWPKGKTVFPDFFKNSTHDMWKELIVEHHETLPFDGLWIVSVTFRTLPFDGLWIVSLTFTGLQLRVRTRKIIFLFLNRNICCGCSKEPS